MPKAEPTSSGCGRQCHSRPQASMTISHSESHGSVHAARDTERTVFGSLQRVAPHRLQERHQACAFVCRHRYTSTRGIAQMRRPADNILVFRLNIVPDCNRSKSVQAEILGWSRSGTLRVACRDSRVACQHRKARRNTQYQHSGAVAYQTNPIRWLVVARVFSVELCQQFL